MIFNQNYKLYDSDIEIYKNISFVNMSGPFIIYITIICVALLVLLIEYIFIGFNPVMSSGLINRFYFKFLSLKINEKKMDQFFFKKTKLRIL